MDGFILIASSSQLPFFTALMPSDLVNSQEGIGGSSEPEDAHLALPLVGNGSAATPHNHDTCGAGLEWGTGTGTWGRLGPPVLAAALDEACHQNAVSEKAGG